MTSSSQRIWKVALITLILYFAAFTALCWYFDLFVYGITGRQHQPWFNLFFIRGVVVAPIVLVGSIIAWRRSRWLALVGFGSCVLWIIWTLLPHNIGQLHIVL